MSNGVFFQDFTPPDVVDKYYVSKESSFDDMEVQAVIGLLKEMGKLNGNGKLGMLLDVGCGFGVGTKLMAKYFNRAIGIDVSPNQIKKAKESEHPDHVEYETGKAENLPVPDDSVDVITAILCAHFFDVDPFVKECKRVLKPGGFVILYSDILSGLRSATDENLPPVIDQMIEMKEKCYKIAVSSSHPERHILDNFQSLYDSIDWAGKKKIEKEMDNTCSLAKVRDLYLSIPFYAKLEETKTCPVTRVLEEAKNTWKMDGVDDKDIPIIASQNVTMIVLVKGERLGL